MSLFLDKAVIVVTQYKKKSFLDQKVSFIKSSVHRKQMKQQTTSLNSEIAICKSIRTIWNSWNILHEEVVAN